MTHLSCEHVSLRANSRPILGGVDLALEGGGTHALLGPCGDGKSTLLGLMQRLIDRGNRGFELGGDIKLDGASIYSGRKQDLRKRISLVEQTPYMFDMTVLENVELVLRHNSAHSRGLRRRIAFDVLEQVGLTEEGVGPDRWAPNLSGGQAQRLAFARVLALEPEVVLMDEPTSALDPPNASRLEEVIHRIAEERTILLVTHDIGLADRLSRQVAFLCRQPGGARILEHGDTTELLRGPQTKELKNFLDCAHWDGTTGGAA